jgi:hypothetical protein
MTPFKINVQAGLRAGINSISAQIRVNFQYVAKMRNL